MDDDYAAAEMGDRRRREQLTLVVVGGRSFVEEMMNNDGDFEDEGGGGGGDKMMKTNEVDKAEKNAHFNKNNRNNVDQSEFDLNNMKRTATANKHRVKSNNDEGGEGQDGRESDEKKPERVNNYAYYAHTHQIIVCSLIKWN